MSYKSNEHRPTMPLSLVSRGETVIIQQIHGGRKLCRRLLDMGMNQGAQVQVLKNGVSGPMIVAVKKDGRLALGRGMTQKILVTLVTNGN